MQEIKLTAIHTKQHDFVTEISYEDFEWLIKQAEKAQRLEEVINETLENMSGYDQFKYSEKLENALKD